MTDKFQPTDSYKGVRDFYPEDMAIQQYIFDTWAKTAESFGFERYDASILEPSALYKAKGAENEEMVNEQTYTFTDRGGREVTLRPEMTPTVARMVAAKKRELAFPLRWYSIPNLFRYERPQKGRLREHWQLNCDIFGSDDISADVEIISLAYQTMIDFGAKREMFKIRVNNKNLAQETVKATGQREGVLLNETDVRNVLRLMDREAKLKPEEYLEKMKTIVGDDVAKALIDTTMEEMVEVMKLSPSFSNLIKVRDGLEDLNISSVLDTKLVRGFDYYTGTIFEIFELDSEGNSTGRSMLGGGRYDNLTDMFGGETVSGVGFGMGDVTMRDFLETHNLLEGKVKTTGAEMVIIPMTPEQNIFAQSAAMKLRQTGTSVSTDISTKKTEKKITSARNKGSRFVIMTDSEENEFTAKNLQTGDKKTGSLLELFDFLKA